MQNNTNTQGNHLRPQVKICGITRIEDALAAAHAGADALGFVFYAKSPRNVTQEQARSIIARLPFPLATIGVFVNETLADILEKVNHCGLSGVQLHGNEPPDLVLQLLEHKITVIKALFAQNTPGFDQANTYRPSAFLVECGKGILPGGNAMTWNWADAGRMPRALPLVLAGGLSPENVADAVNQSHPDGVDVSSGVEIHSGIKDHDKIKRFMESIPKMPGCRSIFHGNRP
ncbi:MAG: phosphoribosylanthranilate isomerase [Proteobacteria bacterium]|nr:phosphoribosylanthranilate isomerase [Pseudomonadota bacterium]MBU4469468.1 phosphoribosylanthranilate isomerase [Pseudomonadota bacterium]